MKIDNSPIVKRWGPWILSEDGFLENVDIHSGVPSERPLRVFADISTIRNLAHRDELLWYFARELLYNSNQYESYKMVLDIFREIFPLAGKQWNPENSAHCINEYIRRSSKQRSRLKPSLRFKILNRDLYRCQACGATAADGAKLHVDHILPVSKGGTNEESNLRALCSECNIGRGNRYDT